MQCTVHVAWHDTSTAAVAMTKFIPKVWWTFWGGEVPHVLKPFTFSWLFFVLLLSRIEEDLYDEAFNVVGTGRTHKMLREAEHQS